MDDPDISEYIKGVSMDGTEFNFDALCLSITKMVIIKMIFTWIQDRMKEEFPLSDHDDPVLFSNLLLFHHDEIQKSISKRFDEIYDSVSRNVKNSFGIGK